MSTFPRITIVTATFNSAHFLEATIQSVLNQHYPALEYMIVDGGSTDGTLEIIQKYEEHLAWWISEPDRGMYDAIQKGFSRSTGEIMTWLNSDDLYPHWALHTVASIFQSLSEVDWITSIRPLIWNENNLATDCMALMGYSKASFLRGEHLTGHDRYTLEVIQQESTFWRRSLWEKAGSRLETSLRYAGDFELWARFYQHSELVGVRTPLGGFRRHGDQLSLNDPDGYYEEAMSVLQRYNGSIYTPIRSFIRLWLAPFFRQRLRRLGSALGICYPASICVYSQDTKKWQIIETFL